MKKRDPSKLRGKARYRQLLRHYLALPNIFRRAYFYQESALISDKSRNYTLAASLNSFYYLSNMSSIKSIKHKSAFSIIR